MNVYMPRQEYEQLAFRDDLVDEPVPDALYRAKAYPSLVFKARCRSDTRRLQEWACFGVDFD